MELSFAPMEGVTYSLYRSVHARMFSGADRYYAPFIAPDGAGRFKTGSLRDILPENNLGQRLVPQILCNDAAPFLAVARELEQLGYEEVNLNVGCPSGTVVSKHKGAGMLADLDSLDRCLEAIFAQCSLRVSVKTRMGLSSTAEFAEILRVYRRYPIALLIVHARDRAGMYRSQPDHERFALALEGSPFPVAYNGDLFTAADLQRLTAEFPALSQAMLGRGAIANPALFRVCKGGAPLTSQELQGFHDTLLEGYLASGLAPQHTIARMKELWFYMLCMFPDGGKAGKGILKSRNLPDYRTAVELLFSTCPLATEAGFSPERTKS